MSVAISNGLLSSSDELHNRIEQFLTHFQAGEQMPAAALQAGVSLKLVNKLIELGQI
jgi:hypothetical protein